MVAAAQVYIDIRTCCTYTCICQWQCRCVWQRQRSFISTNTFVVFTCSCRGGVDNGSGDAVVYLHTCGSYLHMYVLVVVQEHMIVVAQVHIYVHMCYNYTCMCQWLPRCIWQRRRSCLFTNACVYAAAQYALAPLHHVAAQVYIYTRMCYTYIYYTCIHICVSGCSGVGGVGVHLNWYVLYLHTHVAEKVVVAGQVYIYT